MTQGLPRGRAGLSAPAIPERPRMTRPQGASVRDGFQLMGGCPQGSCVQRSIPRDVTEGMHHGTPLRAGCSVDQLGAGQRIGQVAGYAVQQLGDTGGTLSPQPLISGRAEDCEAAAATLQVYSHHRRPCVRRRSGHRGGGVFRSRRNRSCALGHTRSDPARRSGRLSSVCVWCPIGRCAHPYEPAYRLRHAQVPQHGG